MRKKLFGFTPLETRRQRRLTAVNGGLSLTGFTLVEILVVLVIIASLISILLPALAYLRQIAYRIACLNNLKQLGVATEAYVQSYGYYPVCVSDVNESWSDFLADKTISSEKMLGVPVSLWPFHKTAALYNCPILSRADCDISYCYNWSAGRKFTGGDIYAAVVPNYIPPPPPEERPTFHLLRPQDVKLPVRFVLLYDQPVKLEQAKAESGAYDPYKDIDPDDYDPNDPNGQGYLWNDKNVGPHTEGYNILFSDGHVKWHKRWSDSSMSRSPQ